MIFLFDLRDKETRGSPEIPLRFKGHRKRSGNAANFQISTDHDDKKEIVICNGFFELIKSCLTMFILNVNVETKFEQIYALF